MTVLPRSAFSVWREALPSSIFPYFSPFELYVGVQQNSHRNAQNHEKPRDFLSLRLAPQVDDRDERKIAQMGDRTG